MNIEESLTEALAYAKLTKLPNEWEDRGGVWTKAVVLVTKTNTKKNYAIAVNYGDNKPSIVKDFGDVCMIAKVEHIYPYYYLDDSYNPDLRNKNDIINYLSCNGFDENYIKGLLSNKKLDGQDKTDEEKKSDKGKVKGFVVQTAINNQLGDIEVREMDSK